MGFPWVRLTILIGEFFYGNIGVFCFLCGILGHRSSYCSIPISNGTKHRVVSVMEEGGRPVGNSGEDGSNADAAISFDTIGSTTEVVGDPRTRKYTNDSGGSMPKRGDEFTSCG